MTDKQQIKAAALQAAVQTLALLPRETLDAIIKDSAGDAGRQGVFYSSVTAIAVKYEEYIQAG